MLCKLTFLSLPLQALTVRTSLCTCKYPQVCIFRSQLLLYKRTVCNSHMSVPLRALTVRTSLFTCKYSQVYMFQITDTLVYKPIVCKLTYVCALASAHTSNLFVYMQISRSKYIYIYTYSIFRMMDAFVQEPTVWKLTYVYALASAHS